MCAKIANAFLTAGYAESEYFCDRKAETEKLISNLAYLQSRKGRTIVAIDEFQQIADYPEKGVELLRAVASEGVVPEPMSGEFGRRHHLRAASSVRFALDSLTKDEILYRRDA